VGIESAAPMRSTVEQGPDGIIVTIPIRRPIGQVLFLIIWLAVWAWVEFNFRRLSGVSPHQAAAHPDYLLFFTGAWTLGGAYAFLSILWALFGRERLAFSAGRFRLEQTLLGFGRRREFNLRQAEGWRATPERSGTRSVNFSALGYGDLGTITFDYGAETVRCGEGLDEAEARSLIHRLAARGAIRADPAGLAAASAPPSAAPAAPAVGLGLRAPAGPVDVAVERQARRGWLDDLEDVLGDVDGHLQDMGRRAAEGQPVAGESLKELEFFVGRLKLLLKPDVEAHTQLVIAAERVLAESRTLRKENADAFAASGLELMRVGQRLLKQESEAIGGPSQPLLRPAGAG
jgi:hypothetical protein